MRLPLRAAAPVGPSGVQRYQRGSACRIVSNQIGAGLHILECGNELREQKTREKRADEAGRMTTNCPANLIAPHEGTSTIIIGAWSTMEYKDLSP